jgi:hypothetical protein
VAKGDGLVIGGKSMGGRFASRVADEAGVAGLLQGTFALVLAVTRPFQEILNSVMCVEMTFFALTALGLFVIRLRDGSAPGPVCRAVPGHPVTTLLFAAVNVALVLDLFYREPANSAAVAAIAPADHPDHPPDLARRRGARLGRRPRQRWALRTIHRWACLARVPHEACPCGPRSSPGS